MELAVELCTGQAAPDSGHVFFHGQQIDCTDQRKLEKIRSKIGFVAPMFSLINNQSVFENIALPLRYHTTMKNHQIIDQVEPLLKRYEMLHVADARPQKLGRSESLRAAYIRAIVNRPEIVIIHSAMDAQCPLARERFLQLLKEDVRNYNFSVLIITYTPMFFYDPDFEFLLVYEGETKFHGNGIEMLNADNPWLHQYLHDPSHGPMRSFHSQVKQEVKYETAKT